MKKKNATILALITSTVVAGGAAYFALCEKFFKKFFTRRNNYNVLDDGIFKDHQTLLQNSYNWILSTPSEEIKIKSFDNTVLSAVSIEANPKSNLWMIMVHGYRTNYTALCTQAEHFSKMGFNLLMLDLRGHGNSGGKYITMGWVDRLDLICWINHLSVTKPESKIVLFGVSMGASTIMNAVGEKLDKNVICAIEDSGYSNIYEQVKINAKGYMKYGSQLFLKGLDSLTKMHCHYSLKVNTINKLKQSETPVLFIHGESDEVVPFKMVFENYYACKADKDIYTVDGAKHCRAQFDDKYYEKIVTFVKRYL